MSTITSDNLYYYNSDGSYTKVVNNPNPSVGDYIANWFTGNLDYERSLATMQHEQAFNSAEAMKNRKWQEEMSNTAYQRAKADMEKAGLNPYLLYSSASPSSTPSGAVASSGSGVSMRSGKGFDVIFSLLGSLVGTAVSSATSSVISANKISAKAMSDALKNETALNVARYNQMRELHHYNHKTFK